jgi:hypothetical protein
MKKDLFKTYLIIAYYAIKEKLKYCFIKPVNLWDGKKIQHLCYQIEFSKQPHKRDYSKLSSFTLWKLQHQGLYSSMSVFKAIPILHKLLKGM